MRRCACPLATKCHAIRLGVIRREINCGPDRGSDLVNWADTGATQCLDSSRPEPRDRADLDFAEEGVLVGEVSVEGSDPETGSPCDGIAVYALGSSACEEIERCGKQPVSSVFDWRSWHPETLSDLSISFISSMIFQESGHIVFVFIYGTLCGGHVYSFKMYAFDLARSRSFAKMWPLFQALQGKIK